MALLARLVRIFAAVASLLILASFVLFAQEQAAAGTEGQRQKLEGVEAPTPTTGTERSRERRYSPPREVIEDANDYLLSPFASFTEGQDIWLQRIVPAVLGLLLYGVGLSIAANFIRKG